MNSTAARAVIEAGTAAPPSFNGAGWLVAINLGVMTTGFLIASMIAAALIRDWWGTRRTDAAMSPAGIYLRLGILFSVGMTLRTGAAAANLWGWNPDTPLTTGMVLFITRLIDPVAATAGMAGLVIHSLAKPGMNEQLRREPVVVSLWQPREMIRRMISLGIMSMALAILVVTFR